MAAQMEHLNQLGREAVYRMREVFAGGREASLCISDAKERSFALELSEKALFPEKPLLSFIEETEKEMSLPSTEKEHIECFRLAAQVREKAGVQRLIACGGVDDGKSTLIGRILFDTKDAKEQEAVLSNPQYLRKDHSVDYAVLAGNSTEEERQGITVQVSYNIFDWKDDSFLIADVPGHEEYTHNMAAAAAKADAAVIILAANQGIVPQTRRHARICYFMGIRDMVFAINKMDMVSFQKETFLQLAGEIAQMMEAYPGSVFWIVPTAAKSGDNITKASDEMAWYGGGTLLDILKKVKKEANGKQKPFCMAVQRICKSSQMKDAIVKKRVIQGEIASGSIKPGDSIVVYPTARHAKVSRIYDLEQNAIPSTGCPIGIELDRELDVARGSVLADEDLLAFTERLEADILWASDNRLTQGKRYLVKIGTAMLIASVTKILYQVDVHTGEHRYAKQLTKNGLARCELCFSKETAVACEKENRALGTLKLFERETMAFAAYGNIIHTISEEAWRDDGREVTMEERESALGQKAGLLVFEAGEKTKEQMNYVERYLLRMGFHTIQADAEDAKGYLRAGLFVLACADESKRNFLQELFQEENGIFLVQMAEGMKNGAVLLKKIRKWASERIKE